MSKETSPEPEQIRTILQLLDVREEYHLEQLQNIRNRRDCLLGINRGWEPGTTKEDMAIHHADDRNKAKKEDAGK